MTQVPPSIFRSVVRTYVLSVIGVALAIVVVGAAVGADVVVQRDDAAAGALARTMGSELRNHAGEPLPQLDKLVRDEVEEQRWFLRRVEVWRAGRRIGGSAREGKLAPWISQVEGCRSARLEQMWQRICVLHLDPETTIIVASPLGPVLAALVPFVAAIGVVALLTISLFSSLSRHVVRRSLEPLRRFEQHLSSLPALGPERTLPTSWSAREIDALAQTFHTLLERIDRAVAREQRFVADAAHELRTPITRLRGQLELVLGLGVEDEAGERVKLAVGTCEELIRTTEALLALARDRVQLEEAVDLGEVIQGCIQRLDAGTALRVRLLVSEPALVRGDEALLTLAVSNLLDNALKYTHQTVHLRVRVQAGDCIVGVEDHGEGIPEHELASIRQPFVRGRVRPTSARGSGLGLPLVDHVATLHRGVLELRARSPMGLCAELRLPAWADGQSVEAEPVRELAASIEPSK